MSDSPKARCETAFTPGPWEAHNQRSRDGRDLGWIIEHSNGRIAWSSLAYADTNQEANGADPAREANAHLIAAAPELYEALMLFAKHMQADTFAQGDAADECYEAAIAALTKAVYS